MNVRQRPQQAICAPGLVGNRWQAKGVGRRSDEPERSSSSTDEINADHQQNNAVLMPRLMRYRTEAAGRQKSTPPSGLHAHGENATSTAQHTGNAGAGVDDPLRGFPAVRVIGRSPKRIAVTLMLKASRRQRRRRRRSDGEHAVAQFTTTPPEQHQHDQRRRAVGMASKPSTLVKEIAAVDALGARAQRTRLKQSAAPAEYLSRRFFRNA